MKRGRTQNVDHRFVDRLEKHQAVLDEQSQRAHAHIIIDVVVEELGLNQRRNHPLNLPRFPQQPLLNGQLPQPVRRPSVALVADNVPLQVGISLDASSEVGAISGDVGGFVLGEGGGDGRRSEVGEDGLETSGSHDGVKDEEGFEDDLR